jgi:hypothetical protein
MKVHEARTDGFERSCGGGPGQLRMGRRAGGRVRLMQPLRVQPAIASG